MTTTRRMFAVVFETLPATALFSPAVTVQCEQHRLVNAVEARLGSFMRGPEMTRVQRNIGRAPAMLNAPAPAGSPVPTTR